MKRLLLAASLAIPAAPLQASDHIDGSVTTKHRVADLTDLFAFPTPDRPGWLTIILDTYTAVAPTGHFSDKVNYTFYVRRAARREGERPGFDTRDEVAIRCTFVTPHDDAAHTATCATDGGLSATVKYSAVDGPMAAAPSGGLRLFAGQRADPFFFNAVFTTAYSSKGRLLAPLDQNLIDGLNTLAVVLEVEIRQLYPKDPPTLLAVAADSTTQDAADAPVRRLDRIGRPEVSNITLVTHNDETDLRDTYNADRPFAVAADHAQTYREQIGRNLTFFDAIDQHTDWTEANRLALADLLVDDFLVVDTALPCDQASYLEIERSLLAHQAHTTCGGRKPAEDVVDVLLGLYTGGLAGKPIRDGVDHATHAPTTTFPYLAAPDLSNPSKLKIFLTNKALKAAE